MQEIDWERIDCDMKAGVIPGRETLALMHAENIEDTKALSEFPVVFLELLEVFGVQPTKKMLELIAELRQINEPLRNMVGRRGEDKACAIFDMMIRRRDQYIASILRPGEFLVQREVKLPCGCADRVLYHDDKTVTVIEVKGKGSRRDHAQGLGQALVYAEAFKDDPDVIDVTPALFVCGERDEWLAGACASAGVTYINIPLCLEKTLDDYAAVA